MRVSVIGTGYVGLVSGVCLASKGHQVTCVDIDPAKIEQINSAVPPIHEEGLQELLNDTVGKTLNGTTDLRSAVLNSDLSLIAVGTPFDGRHIDLTYIREAARQIGEILRDKEGYHLVVVKSTVVPGTTSDVVAPIIAGASGKKLGEGFGVGMNPEFLREGNAIEDFQNPDRIVLGGSDARAISILDELYAIFDGVDIVRTDPRTAEMIKYTANSLLATLISFSNEIGNLCAKVGVDAMDAMHGMHLDKRFMPLMPDGSRVKPGSISYLEPGCGFGGSCFPKDVKALVAYGEDAGNPMPLLRSVIDINKVQPQRMIDMLKARLPELAGLKIAVLGIAFKPGTNDIRESPALPIVQALLDASAKVVAYDPTAQSEAEKVFGKSLVFSDTLETAISDVDAVLIVTRWKAFEAIPALLASRETQPLIVDGRRMLDKNSVDNYVGIGLPHNS